MAYARSLILVFMLMSMLMSYASVDFFVFSFVLFCAYAYVTSEDQAFTTVKPSNFSTQKLNFSTLTLINVTHSCRNFPMDTWIYSS